MKHPNIYGMISVIKMQLSNELLNIIYMTVINRGLRGGEG
jgi:hypothetical protein